MYSLPEGGQGDRLLDNLCREIVFDLIPIEGLSRAASSKHRYEPQ